MDVKIVMIQVIVVTLMDCAFSASLGAAGKKGLRQQYNFPLDQHGDFGRLVDDYFRKHHNSRKKIAQSTPSSTPSPRRQQDYQDVDSCKWTAWGPKTRLFGCGEQTRTLHSDNGSCQPQIERRQSCHEPTFGNQSSYFKRYFVDHVKELYGKTETVRRNVESQSRQPLDLLFLVDRSQSMERYEFSSLRSAMADLIRKMTKMNLIISPQHSQVAMVTFGTSSKLEFKFNEHTSSEEVAQAILNVPRYRSGSSQLEQALQYCSKMFDPSEQFGARTNSGRVLLILTDGESTLNPEQAAEDLRRRLGVEIFVVGFKRISEDQMMAVSSHPKHHHVFYFETARKVHKMVRQLNSQKKDQ